MKSATLRLLAVLAMALVTLAAPLRAEYPSAISKPIDLRDLRNKTLVAWCSPANLEQRGSGVMTVECPGNFDAIVLGEIKPGAWMAGSENFARTLHEQGPSQTETAQDGQLVQIAVVYDGTKVTIYRDAEVYSEYDITAPADFSGVSEVIFGVRHKAIMSGFFAGEIEEARLYNQPLTQDQIKALRLNEPGTPAPLAMWTFENGSTADLMGTYPPGVLFGDAAVKKGRLVLDGAGDYMKTPTEPKYEKTLHFRPDTGSAGDTIPFYWKGQYHVYYLRENNWAHIVSKDLVHWEELPIALKKGDDPLGPDGEACWTGSIIEQNGVFRLFYTGKNSQDPKGDQKVMLATSKDLINWEVQPDQTFYADGKIYWSKPVNGAIDDKVIYHHQAFRDPAVFWNEDKKEWWMMLHSILADGSAPTMGLYASKDLVHWEARPPLVVYSVGVSGDCPDIFQTNGKWFIHCADNRYFSADKPEGPYTLSDLPYDTGDLRVPKVMWDGKRNILIGWMGDREANSDAGKMIWGGTLSMARELYANESGELCQRPVQEIIDAFGKQVFAAKKGQPLPINEKLPRDFMLHARLQARSPDTKVTLAFRQNSQGGEGYRLLIDFATGEVDLGDAHRSNKRVCKIDPSKPLDIRLFVVGTVVECFINDAYSFTMRVYDSWGSGLSVHATSGSAEVETLTVSTQK